MATARSLILLTSLLLAAPGCQDRRASSGGGTPAAPAQELAILSGSENRSLEPLLKRFGEANGVAIRVDYLGSVDIMLQLESGATGYDAVWPAQSLWVDLGDRERRVRHLASIMRSPVVFGVKESVARRLGWIGKDVTVDEILQAAAGGRLRFMMTSATQSNSGASAYLGFLYAFAGRPDQLTAAHLRDPKVRDKIRRFMAAVDRSSGSSGWLKDLFLKEYERYDAMVNYEALVIETNQALVPQGREPLHVIYPVDGLTVADSPLGYVNRGDPEKERLFQKLQEHLLSPEVQNQVLAMGRRVGLAGISMKGAGPSVFNPAWGINLERVLNPIRFPQAELIRQALELYQVAFRKPSFTVYCLDYSGSMRGRALQDLQSAMGILLDSASARRYMLQASPEDRTVVIPFNHAPIDEWSASGNGEGALTELLAKVRALPAEGGTDIYRPVMRAFDRFKAATRLEDHFPAVILMTDGRSNEPTSIADLRQHLQGLQLRADVPVYGILFGEASKEQLQEIAQTTSGRVFDGRADLVQAFREARGYN